MSKTSWMHSSQHSLTNSPDGHASHSNNCWIRWPIMLRICVSRWKSTRLSRCSRMIVTSGLDSNVVIPNYSLLLRLTTKRRSRRLSPTGSRRSCKSKRLSKSVRWRWGTQTLMMRRLRKWLKRRFVSRWSAQTMRQPWRTTLSSLEMSPCFILTLKLMVTQYRLSLIVALRARLLVGTVQRSAICFTSSIRGSREWLSVLVNLKFSAEFTWQICSF